MDLNLNQDIHKLMADTENFKQLLKKLEQDQAVWARKHEEKDLEKVINCVKRLEFDLSTTMSDCACLAHQEESNVVGVDLHHAFSGLNALFKDLKKVSADLSGSYIHRGDLDHMEIDWGRFSKTVGQIQKHLQGGENRLREKEGKRI
ncbi:MAG: hypothetical protein JRI93_02390 [Deltaproteobacteria bacterium]|nr:hypothetical protein [Deltaproteobacteria bacterium]MBW2176700.1 hypothetical protein [Deltaproteobacteria bacterium]